MRVFGVTLLMAVTVACRSDVTAADSEDALAQDSSLSLLVLQAQGDTAPVIGEVDPTIDQRPVRSETSRSMRPSSARVVRTPPPAESAPARAPARTTAQPAPVAAAPSAPAAATSVAAATKPAPPPRRVTATAAAGTTISLSADRRICVNTSRIGDRFTARVNRAVRSSSGTVIPSGARASGVVTALTGSLGEEHLQVDIRSVTVDGRSRSIDARVTDVQLDRRAGSERCIPDGGNIEARLTAPLRVTQ